MKLPPRADHPKIFCNKYTPSLSKLDHLSFIIMKWSNSPKTVGKFTFKPFIGLTVGFKKILQ